MKSLVLIFGFMLVSAGLLLCQPKTAFGQDRKTLAKTKPPVLVRYVKPGQKKAKIKPRNLAIFKSAKNKRKRPTLRRKVDLSKVPRVISVTKQP